MCHVQRYIICHNVTRTCGRSECSRSISRDPYIYICGCAVSKQIELLVSLSLSLVSRKRAYSSTTLHWRSRQDLEKNRGGSPTTYTCILLQKDSEGQAIPTDTCLLPLQHNTFPNPTKNLGKKCLAHSCICCRDVHTTLKRDRQISEFKTG